MYNSGKITLSMIVRNEEKYLRECLESVKDIVGEMVIVDTGSTDGTVLIAKEYGASVYGYEWKDDFSAARNYALSKCTGKWILYMDADERLSKHSAAEIKKIISGDNFTGRRCIVNNLDDFNGKPNFMRYTRLFPNDPEVKFSGAVHEQIDESLLAQGYDIIDSGIEIIHVGYNVPGEEIKNKAQRNLNLLLKEYEKNKSSYNAFQLANTFSILKDYVNARKYYMISVGGCDLKNEYASHAYLNLSDYELRNHAPGKALEYINQGLMHDSTNPQLNLLAADIFFRLKRRDGIIDFCKSAYLENNKILSGRNKAFLSVGLNTEAVLCKGIYYSLLTGDENALQYFLVELDKKNRKLFNIFGKIIGEGEFSAADKKELKNIISEDNLDAVLVLLENDSDKQRALDLATAVKETFKGNSKYLKTLGLLYSENNMLGEAESIFEESLTLEEKDPAAVFYLISVLIQSNRLEKIPELLSFAEKEFGRIPEFNSGFELLKGKLDILFNNQQLLK